MHKVLPGLGNLGFKRNKVCRGKDKRGRDDLFKVGKGMGISTKHKHKAR